MCHETQEATNLQADDEEPVTRDWLCSIGFHTEDGQHENYLLFEDNDYFFVVWGTESQPFYVPHGDGKPIQEFSYETMTHQMVPNIESRRLPDSVNPKTRGDVRRLCNALGIELKNPK